jgi:hypothetical protein
MEWMRNAYSILVGNPECNRQLRRCRRRCEDNIRMDLRGNRVGRCGLIRLAHDRHQWQALVYTVMNLQVPLKAGYILTI